MIMMIILIVVLQTEVHEHLTESLEDKIRQQTAAVCHESEEIMKCSILRQVQAQSAAEQQQQQQQ